MGITAIQKIVDVTYQVYFTEPLFEVFGDKNRQKLVMHLLKSYELKLNDIKFNSDFPSDNLIHISKFYGQTFFNTHLGLEQIELRVSRIQSEKQLETLFVGIVPLVAKEFISRQRFSINQHLKIDKVNNYLNSLNPHSPSKLKDLIDSNGVFYKLSTRPKHQSIQNLYMITGWRIIIKLYKN